MAAYLNQFQLDCREAISTHLAARGIEIDFTARLFERTDLDRQGHEYLQSNRFFHQHDSFDIYIYPDEVGFSRNDKWIMCESQDFDSPEELLASFIATLLENIDRVTDHRKGIE